MFDTYWTETHSWPRETRLYVPMARAVLRLAQAMFPREWTGDEPEEARHFTLPLPPLQRDAKAHNRVQAHGILSKASGEYVPKPAFIRMPGNFASNPPQPGFDMPDYRFTAREWEEAIEVVNLWNEPLLPGLRRFSAAKAEFLRAAALGEIETAGTPKGEAIFSLINPDVWSLANWNVFHCCEFSPRKPKSIYATGSHLVFVSRRSLEVYEATAQRRLADEHARTQNHSESAANERGSASPTMVSSNGHDAANHRLADEYDAAQERGEAASAGKPVNVLGGNNKATVEDIGLTRKDIHETHTIRDAEVAEPGIVRKTLSELLDAGQAASDDASAIAMDAKNVAGKTTAALKALSALYPAGIPAGLPEELRRKAVNEWVKANHADISISLRTIATATTRYRAGERA